MKCGYCPAIRNALRENLIIKRNKCDLIELTPWYGTRYSVVCVFWDFSHLKEAVLTILKQNPASDPFLYGGVKGCYDSGRSNQKGAEGPYIVAINIPTLMAKQCDNQDNARGFLLPFGGLRLPYRWDKVSDRAFGGRLHILVCDMDKSALPNESDQAYHLHEYADIFTITPSDLMRTDQEWDVRLNVVDYFVQLDGGGEFPVEFE